MSYSQSLEFIFTLFIISSGDEYSEVRTFMKKERTVKTKYQLITTSVNKTIHLSERHIIYARAGSTHRFYPMYVSLKINKSIIIQNDDITGQIHQRLTQK